MRNYDGVDIGVEYFEPMVVREKERDPPSVGIFDNPTRCYIVNEEWAKHIIGAVYTLTSVAAWTGDDDERNAAIQAVYQFLIGDNCNVFELRQNPDNDCQLQQSLDGGDNWTTVFDYSLCTSKATTPDNLQAMIDQLDALQTAYDGTVTSVAPDLVYDDSATDDIRDLALCHAAGELVALMCEAELEYRRQIALVSTITAVALGLLGVIISVATLGTATPFYLTIAAALAGGFGTVFGGLSQAILQNSDARNEVTCCMVEALRGATITQTAFEQSLDNCGFTGGSNEAQLAGAIVELLTQDDMYIAFLDYMQRSYTLAELNLATCDCETGWTHTFDFTVSDGGFAERRFTNWSGPMSNYIAGTGWSFGDADVGSPVTDYRRVISINRTFAESNITSLSMTYNYTKGTVDNGANTARSQLIKNNDVNQASDTDTYNTMANGNDQTDQLIASVTGDEITFYLSSSLSTVDQHDGSCLITSCTVKGIGVNPFI